MKTFPLRFFGPLLALLLGVARAEAAPAAATDRPRLIVLADMGNEPDEEQQILHLLMCSNELELEGLLAVTGKHLRPEDSRPYRRVLHPELFHQLIDGYEKIHPNLQLHASGWHSPRRLREIVASGQTGYGVPATGPGKASEGSRLILAALTKTDPRPVHIVINAGSNTLAQALIDYRAGHSPAEVGALVAKLRVYENQAQDDAGAWICHEFPAIHWIRSRYQTRCYGGPTNADLGPSVWRPFAHTARGQDDWAARHVRTGHGALGALYPQRKIFTDDIHFIEGGGTLPWLRLVSPGLTDPDEPSWGGWSGRYTAAKVPNVPSPYKDIAEQEQASLPFHTYTDLSGVTERWVDPTSGKIHNDVYAPIWPWRAAMWQDFQARMDWCVEPYAKANHHPLAALNGDTSRAILRLKARTGDTLKFSAAGSTDPDQDALRYSWWIYPEAGRQPYGKPLPLENPTAENIALRVPADAAGQELHLILEVWDQSPIVPLAAYRRAVIAVAP
ncbi:MAG: nucleoside hydrolase-like domain-containing protein [Opitutaceae bacterium]